MPASALTLQLAVKLSICHETWKNLKVTVIKAWSQLTRFVIRKFKYLGEQGFQKSKCWKIVMTWLNKNALLWRQSEETQLRCVLWTSKLWLGPHSS